MTKSTSTGLKRRLLGTIRFRFFAFPLACVIAAITAASSGRVSLAAAAPQAGSFAIAPEALAQIDALIREKETRSPVQRKIDSQLLYEMRIKQRVPVANGIQTVETDVPYASDGHVIVDIKALLTPGFFAGLAALGVEVISSNSEGGMLRAHINIEQVEALVSLPEVTFVQPRQDAIVVRRQSGPLRVTDKVADSLDAALSTRANVTPAIPNVLVTQ